MSYAYTCNQCGIEVTDPDLDSHLDNLLGEYHGFDEAIKVATEAIKVVIRDLAMKDDLGAYYPAEEVTEIIQLCPSCDKKFIEGLKIKPEYFKKAK